MLNEQREAVYAHRRQVLESREIHPIISSLLRLAAQDAVEAASCGRTADDSRKTAVEAFSSMLTPGAAAKCLQCPEEELADKLAKALIERYDAIENEFGDAELLRVRERELLLKTVDRHWMEHMDNMEHLRQGIGLVSYAQRDPLKEYQLGAFKLFEQMKRNIRYDTAEAILSISEMKVRP